MDQPSSPSEFRVGRRSRSMNSVLTSAPALGPRSGQSDKQSYISRLVKQSSPQTLHSLTSTSSRHLGGKSLNTTAELGGEIPSWLINIDSSLYKKRLGGGFFGDFGETWRSVLRPYLRISRSSWSGRSVAIT